MTKTDKKCPKHSNSMYLVDNNLVCFNCKDEADFNQKLDELKETPLDLNSISFDE